METTRFQPEPAVSVILPTFNREKTLPDALESVIAQTFTDWELIVVDDGGTDETPAIIDSFIAKGGNIRYMRHANRGAALSRNAGIQASFGRYITFLDSDDSYLPRHLESRMAVMASDPSPDLLSGGFRGEDDIRVVDRFDPERTVHIGDCILGGTLFGRREVFFSLGGFRNLDYAEDADLWDRAAALYNVLKLTAPRTYVYSRADDSITRNR